MNVLTWDMAAVMSDVRVQIAIGLNEYWNRRQLTMHGTRFRIMFKKQPNPQPSEDNLKLFCFEKLHSLDVDWL